MAHAESSVARPTLPSFTAIIKPAEEEGGFVVTFPDIPDLATQGETIEEARWMAEDCLRGYLDVLRDAGRPMPGSGAAVPPAESVALQFQIIAA
jgi:antitoxin HicB